MKRGWIIFLSILAVILLAIGIYAYNTYSTLKELQNTQDVYIPQIRTDLQAIMSGDCSKQSDLQLNLNKIQNVISKSCRNMMIKTMITKVSQQNGITNDPCTMLAPEKNPFPKILNLTNKICSQGKQSITQADINSLKSGLTLA